jgi:hypothetical protein
VGRKIRRAGKSRDRWALSTEVWAGGATATHASGTRVQTRCGAPLLSMSWAEDFFRQKTSGFFRLGNFFTIGFLAKNYSVRYFAPMMPWPVLALRRLCDRCLLHQPTHFPLIAHSAAHPFRRADVASHH